MKDVILKKISAYSHILQKFSKVLMVPTVAMSFVFMGNFINMSLNVGTMWYKNVCYFLPIIFTVCVAIGLSKTKNHYVAMSAILAFLIVASMLPELVFSLHLRTLFGILIGIYVAIIHNECDKVELPSWMLYVNGEKFSVFLSVIASFGFSVVMSPVMSDLDLIGTKIENFVFTNCVACAGAYGILNRLLVPMGLHHLLNNFVCFQIGQHNGLSGEIGRFLMGDARAGYLTAGMFPVTMFGIPAMCFAILLCLKKTERKKWAFVCLTTALTAAFTGVTEVFEFMFIFISPFLYCLHVIFTGIACAVTSYLDIRIAWCHACGWLEYLLFFTKSAHFGEIVYVGSILFAVYFVSFYAVIKLLKIDVRPHLQSREKYKNSLNLSLWRPAKYSQIHELAEEYICALGGVENIKELFSCTTRLRLVINNLEKVDKSAILRIGAFGVKNIGSNHVQIIIGLGVDDLCEEMDAIMLSSRSKELERGSVDGFDAVC